jgi:hypothetical protein
VTRARYLRSRTFALQPPRLGEFTGGGLRVPAALIRLREQEAPGGILWRRRARPLEMIDRRRAPSLLQQNPPEQAAGLGQIALERHGPLRMPFCVGQALVLLVQPPEIEMRGAGAIRSRQRALESLPGTLAIAERQTTHADVDGKPRQRIVRRCCRLERRQRLGVPALLLQQQSVQLVPQRPAARRSARRAASPEARASPRRP